VNQPVVGVRRFADIDAGKFLENFFIGERRFAEVTAGGSMRAAHMVSVRSDHYKVSASAAAAPLMTKSGRLRIAVDMRDVDFATSLTSGGAKGASASPTGHFLRNNLNAVVNPRTGRTGAQAIDFQFVRDHVVLEIDPVKLASNARQTSNPKAFVAAFQATTQRTMNVLGAMREGVRRAPRDQGMAR